MDPLIHQAGHRRRLIEGILFDSTKVHHLQTAVGHSELRAVVVLREQCRQL